jgi:hypothetical protein
MKKFILIFASILVLAIALGEEVFTQTKKEMTSDYMTIDEAVAALKVPGAAAPLATNLGTSPKLPAHSRPPFTSIEPIKLFENLGASPIGNATGFGQRKH